MYLNLELRLPGEIGDPPVRFHRHVSCWRTRIRIEVVHDSTPQPNRPVSVTKEFGFFLTKEFGFFRSFVSLQSAQPNKPILSGQPAHLV